MQRSILFVVLAFGLVTLVVFHEVLQAQPRHTVAKPPSVAVTSVVATVGSQQVITYRVTPHRVYDMLDFHVKTLEGAKVSGEGGGGPDGWTPKPSKGTKSFGWAATSSQAQPLPEGQTTEFTITLSNSIARITPFASWYATRDGKTDLPPRGPGGLTPAPGTVYGGPGAETPPNLRLRKKKPFIDYGTEDPDPPIKAPYVTLGIPEYTLGEPDEDNVGIAAGGTWTASAASTESETLFTVLLSTDRSFAAYREMEIVSEGGNDIVGTALVHFFEGNVLGPNGQCGFSILVDPDAAAGQRFFAMVVADDDRNGMLDLKVDIESDPYAFVVE